MRIPIGMIFLMAVILLAWAVPAHGQEIFVNENAPSGAPRPAAGTYTERSVTITFDRPVYVENYHANILRNDLRVGADGGWKGEIASVDIATTTETATREIVIHLVSPFPSGAEVYVFYTGANAQTIQYDLKSVSGVGVAHFDIRYLLFTGGDDANAPRPLECGVAKDACINGKLTEGSDFTNLNHYSWTCEKESNSIRGTILCHMEKDGCSAGVKGAKDEECSLPLARSGESKDGTCGSGLIGECTYYCGDSTWRVRSNSCRRERKNCVPETIKNCSLNFTVSPGNTMQGVCINPDDANKRWQGNCGYTCTDAGVWREFDNSCAEYVPDTTPPTLIPGKVSPLVIDDKTEPTYTFNSSESGVLVAARADPGGCMFVFDLGGSIRVKDGGNTVTLEKARDLPITSGDYAGVSGVKTCSFSVRDYYGNTSEPLGITYTVISSDTTPPILTEVTPVPSPSDTLYPVYVFRSNEWGRVTYSTKAGNTGRDCTSSSGNTYEDSHLELAPTIVEPDTDTEVKFNYLYDGVIYNGCVITVKDKYGNTATLDINEFQVDWSPNLHQIVNVNDEIFNLITPELRDEMEGQLKANNGRGKILRDTLAELTELYKDLIYSEPLEVLFAHYISDPAAVLVRLNKQLHDGTLFTDDFIVKLSDERSIAATAVYVDACDGTGNTKYCEREIYITLAESIPTGTSATVVYTQDSSNTITALSPTTDIVLDTFSQSITLPTAQKQQGQQQQEIPLPTTHKQPGQQQQEIPLPTAQQQPGQQQQEIPPLAAQRQQHEEPRLEIREKRGSSGTTVTSFTRNLTIGSIGEDVRALQQFLNRKGYTINEPGRAGSPGFETTYFGALTQDAVRQYQETNSITPARGFFGPKTRAHVNAVLADETTDQSPGIPQYILFR